jgi:hypothetical protein
MKRDHVRESDDYFIAMERMLAPPAGINDNGEF